MSKGTRFLKSIKNYFFGSSEKGGKERILTPLNQQAIQESKLVKELVKKNKGLESQLSKIKADKRDKKVEQKNVFDDIELIKELNEKSEKIKREDEKAVFNFMPLFKKLINTEKKLSSENFVIEICDKDDKVVFDKLKTIKVMDNQDLAIYGKSGHLWSRGKTLRDIIWKPDTLKNQIRRKRILLPFNEDFKFIPDLENEEMPEISYDEETQQWNESEERFKTIKQMFMERDLMISDLRKDKEHHEQVISDLRNRNQDLELAKKSWESQAKNSQSELSIALENEKEAMGVVHKLERDVTKSQEQKELSDELKEVHEDANEKLKKELEDDESQTKRKMEKIEAWKDIERAKKIVPKEKIIKEKGESDKESQNNLK